MEELYFPSSENKGADVTAKLICVFVFAYAKCWFSYEEAQLYQCRYLIEACIGYFGIRDNGLFFKGYWGICVFYFGIWDIQELWDMGYWNLFHTLQ